MRAYRAAVCAAVILLGSLASDQSEASATPATVTIRNDRGGYLIEYALRMLRFKESGARVHFNGNCASACTLFLALPQEQTCITQRAEFRFHAPSGAGQRGNLFMLHYLLASYPDWVRDWLRENGGLSHRLVTMDYEYASRFLPPCPAKRWFGRAEM